MATATFPPDVSDSVPSTTLETPSFEPPGDVLRRAHDLHTHIIRCADYRRSANSLTRQSLHNCIEPSLRFGMQLRFVFLFVPNRAE